MYALVFYAGAAWETGRFFFLFELVCALVNPSSDFLVNLLLLWLGSGQFCSALLFFLCGYMPLRFFCLRPVTAVFTFMGILPPLIAVLAHALPQGVLSPLRFPMGPAIPLFIMGVDTLFLLYLLLYRRRDAGCT
jgi:hypothetical protein